MEDGFLTRYICELYILFLNCLKCRLTLDTWLFICVFETHILDFWAVQCAVWHSTLDKSRTNFATRGSLSTSNLQPGRAGRLQFKKQTNTNEIRAGKLKRLSQTNLKYKYQIKTNGEVGMKKIKGLSLWNLQQMLQTGNKSVGSTVYRLSDELDNQLRRFAGHSRWNTNPRRQENLRKKCSKWRHCRN